jgi:hypothetical protein
MQANQTDQAKPWKHPKGGNRGLEQAYQFRDLAASQAMELKEYPCEELEDKLARAKALQALSGVWSDASDRIRILRGRPLPGSLRPIAKPKKAKAASLPPPTEGAGEQVGK